ncbi:MAG: fumarylacetoacetate hydrolase family protein [Paracoccaceae bacterium]|nr:fumarylacetoacetate hydrolase family protein [Paracoccaceae bacterium]
MAILALRPPSTEITLATTSPDTFVGLHRIFCVGRNYAEHAREMGHDPNAEPPFFFSKPITAAVPSVATLPFPVATENLHHEAELCVLIKTSGANIDAADALDHVWGYSTGNDLTRRDVQAQAKEKRRPWDMSKGFDQSAIFGAVAPVSEVGHLEGARIRCDVDGVTTQSADLSDMIWPVADVIAFLSTLVTLHPGDLIMTGTPAGVGPIKRGQTCRVQIDGLEDAAVTYAP